MAANKSEVVKQEVKKEEPEVKKIYRFKTSGNYLNVMVNIIMPRKNNQTGEISQGLDVQFRGGYLETDNDKVAEVLRKKSYVKEIIPETIEEKVTRKYKEAEKALKELEDLGIKTKLEVVKK